MRLNGWFLGAAMLLAAAPSYATTISSLGVASGYNVFVFSSYSDVGSTDIEGSAAIGKDFNATASLGFLQNPGSANPAYSGLVVGGNLSLAGGQDFGNAWVGGSVSSFNNGSMTIKGNLVYGTAISGSVNVFGTSSKVGNATPPIDFTAAAASLTSLSASLKNLTANGTVTGGNNYGYTAYTLTATNCTVCVFNMPGGTINSVTINAPTGATVVVNVSGSSSTFTNGSMNYTGGATAATTIFNFNSATAISTSGLGFNGSILAPLATFSGQNGNMNGELIAKAVSGQTGQFDSGYIFRGDFGLPGTTGAAPAPTPEPSTWISLLTALAAFGGIQARRWRA